MASLICPRATTCLRSFTPHAPRFFASQRPQSSPFTTATPTSRQSQQHRPSITSQISSARPLQPAVRSTRHASSVPSQTTPLSASTSTNDGLTWNRFFDLRRKRRYVNLGASVLTAATAIAAFGPVIAQQDIDGWAARISGLDPVIVLGITTLTVGAGGWLCGPSFGSAGFRMWAARKGWRTGIAEKEKSFYARIRRYRADPSSSSPQNPLPDYYGEKIASVKDYRRWLKDQRAFNRKKQKNIL